MIRRRHLTATFIRRGATGGTGPRVGLLRSPGEWPSGVRREGCRSSIWGCDLAAMRIRAMGVATMLAVAVALAAVEAVPAEAVLMTPRFKIDSGAAFTNSTQAQIGDGGWSPFFRPGVLVWDGGSIVGGCGGGPGMGFSEQTLRLIPHPCLSYESPSRHARIADMLSEATTQVDARYDSRGDQNVCVVLAGGGDISKGRRPVGIYEDLVRYCLGRRAAGFRVVVVTLLPRSDPPRFETDRTQLNGMVRDAWPAFADGLADVAADARIGDYGDHLDRRYYRPDAIHPNAAGYGVMAAVTAPVLNGFAWKSNDCRLRFRNAEGAWTEWQQYVARSSWQLEAGDGPKTVHAEYRDDGGILVAASDTIGLDTGRPVTKVRRRARARRGTSAILSYSVMDPEPSCGSADVTIRIRTLGGRLVKTLRRFDRPTNAALRVRFTCRLKPRVYRFYVLATDAAGNRQASVANNRLMVR